MPSAEEKTDVYRDPDFDLICTSHIERMNGSMRQGCKRLTRLTYAFSKKWDNLDAALALHFAYYNFSRVHKSIKMTSRDGVGDRGQLGSYREYVNDISFDPQR